MSSKQPRKPTAAAAADGPPAPKRRRAKPLADTPPPKRRAKPLADAAPPASVVPRDRMPAAATPGDPTPPPKRRRAKPLANVAPPASVVPSERMPAEPLAPPATIPQPKHVAAVSPQPAPKRQSTSLLPAAPVAASHSSGMPARPLTPVVAPHHERVAAADLPRKPATIAQISPSTPAAADPPVFIAAIPRSEARRPALVPLRAARSNAVGALAVLRKRIPISNGALSVFGVSAIFLIGLVFGFVLFEDQVQTLEARASMATPIPRSAGAKLSTPAPQPTAGPSPEARPAIVLPPKRLSASPTFEPRPAVVLSPTPVSARPTSAPAPTAPAPTQPLPIATPSVAELLQRLSAAEQALRTGTIEAILAYSNGSSASAQLRFDIGSAGQKPRFWMRSTYTSTSGSQVIEHLTIGDQGWEHQPDGRWIVGQPQAAILDQLRVYLPQTDQITQAEQSGSDDTTTLRWYDASRNADMMLMIDRATGVPRELHQITRANGVQLIVIYTQWNAPVDIVAPPEG